MDVSADTSASTSAENNRPIASRRPFEHRTGSVFTLGDVALVVPAIESTTLGIVLDRIPTGLIERVAAVLVVTDRRARQVSVDAARWAAHHPTVAVEVVERSWARDSTHPWYAGARAALARGLRIMVVVPGCAPEPVELGRLLRPLVAGRTDVAVLAERSSWRRRVIAVRRRLSAAGGPVGPSVPAGMIGLRIDRIGIERMLRIVRRCPDLAALPGALVREAAADRLRVEVVLRQRNTMDFRWPPRGSQVNRS